MSFASKKDEIIINIVDIGDQVRIIVTLIEEGEEYNRLERQKISIKDKWLKMYQILNCSSNQIPQNSSRNIIKQDNALQNCMQNTSLMGSKGSFSMQNRKNSVDTMSSFEMCNLQAQRLSQMKDKPQSGVKFEWTANQCPSISFVITKQQTNEENENDEDEDEDERKTQEYSDSSINLRKIIDLKYFPSTKRITDLDKLNDFVKIRSDQQKSNTDQMEQQLNEHSFVNNAINSQKQYFLQDNPDTQENSNANDLSFSCRKTKWIDLKGERNSPFNSCQRLKNQFIDNKSNQIESQTNYTDNKSNQIENQTNYIDNTNEMINQSTHFQNDSECLQIPKNKDKLKKKPGLNHLSQQYSSKYKISYNRGNLSKNQ